MTLTQRLTRASLTFIILGTAAAAMPQSGEAKATTEPGDCTNHKLFYRLTTNPSFADTSGAFVSKGSSVTVYAASSSDGSSYTSAASTYNYTATGDAVLAPSTDGTSVSVIPTASGILTGTYTSNTITYSIDYPINITGS